MGRSAIVVPSSVVPVLSRISPGIGGLGPSGISGPRYLLALYAFDVRRAGTLNLAPAHWTDRSRLFPSERNFLGFVADCQTFALTQRVFDFFLANFDFQHLAAIRHRKPKYRVVFRRAARPERKHPIVVP